MDNSVKTFTHISEFLDYLGNDFTGLTSEMRANLDQEPTFAFNCSKHYADLIKNSAEPVKLLREVLPSKDELKEAPGFVDDPVGDLPAGNSPPASPNASCKSTRTAPSSFRLLPAVCAAGSALGATTPSRTHRISRVKFRTGSTSIRAFGKSSSRAETRSRLARDRSATSWKQSHSTRL